MKSFGLGILVISVLLMVGCSGYGNSSSNNPASGIAGNWTTTVSNQGGAQMIVFTSALSQSTLYGVTATNLHFSMGSACFPSGATASGSVMPSGNATSFVMTVQGTNATGTMLTLQGSLLSSSSISGTWTLSGLISGCSGSGSFTMTKM
ncbi:MAG TPA: hypothetical protein VKW78_21105 [Terriglobales bacterium]|nr:hypothetical protein [Terriglobales bacterium]